MSYITRAQALFTLDTIPAERRRHAATAVADQLEEQLDLPLLELYGFLALTTGTATTREQVHDAWVVWMHDIDPKHPRLVPFGELSPDEQALDQPYGDAIHRAARTL